MLKIIWLASLLVMSGVDAVPKLKSYNCPKPCAKGCEIGCKTLSWASWGCGLCCWLLKCGGEAPAVTRQVMQVSEATQNAANYFKVQCGEGK